MKEKPGEGLPPQDEVSGKEKPGEKAASPDEEADAAERVCRERLTAALRKLADRPLPGLYLSLDRLRRPAREEEAAEKNDTACEKEVTRLLGRELEPSERVLVGVMRRQGKRPEGMADVLRKLPAENPKR